MDGGAVGQHIAFPNLHFVIPAHAGIHGLTYDAIILRLYNGESESGTIYIGMTNDLHRRVHEHREKMFTGFSKENRTTRLVYYEHYADVRDAIQREKQLKKWNRAWKIDLIEQSNPEWRDLWFDLNR